MDKLISPEVLHARAAGTEEVSVTSDTVSVMEIVRKFLENSQGVHRTPCLLCGVYTKEYTIVPIPSELADDALGVKQLLKGAGYFVTLKDDALIRFNEEVVMVICWDPKVIEAARLFEETEINSGTLGDIYCIIPGREGIRCDNCYLCYTDDNQFISDGDGK